MGALRYLFSFKGRINRAKLWLFLLISAIASLPQVLLPPSIDYSNVLTMIGSMLVYVPPPEVRPIGWAQTGADVILFWAGLALTLKRLHDRNKGPVWLLPLWLGPYVAVWAGMILLFLLPAKLGTDALGYLKPEHVNWIRTGLVLGYALMLWAFIELYCVRGTRGGNRFGSDPLGNFPQDDPAKMFCSAENPVEGCIPKPGD